MTVTPVIATTGIDFGVESAAGRVCGLPDRAAASRAKPRRHATSHFAVKRRMSNYLTLEGKISPQCRQIPPPHPRSRSRSKNKNSATPTIPFSTPSTPVRAQSSTRGWPSNARVITQYITWWNT